MNDHIPPAQARDLLDAVPTPPLPTLADMTEEERAACQWMQADIIGGDEPLVIAHIERSDGTAVILDRNGRYDEVPAGAVTPRPDLPRMEWPGDQEPDPAPALAAMIAGMHEEWGVSYTGVNHGGRHTEWGYETRDEAERQARRYRRNADMHPARIVRRYVTTEEEA